MPRSLRLTLMYLSLATGLVAQRHYPVVPVLSPDPSNLGSISPQATSDPVKNVSVETLSALPVDMDALMRFKGPVILRHEGRAFRLDLTGWQWTIVCDGPRVGPDGVHVVGTYAKSLPGMDGQAELTIWLLPGSRNDAPFDPLPRMAERTPERRVINMGGLPGNLHLASFDYPVPGRTKPRTWYVSAEQIGPGWRLWLEFKGTLIDPNPLVQEATRVAGSLRLMVGMPQW
jgi:hypothetical protein